jgi:hypothetical protein
LCLPSVLVYADNSRRGGEAKTVGRPLVCVPETANILTTPRCHSCCHCLLHQVFQSGSDSTSSGLIRVSCWGQESKSALLCKPEGAAAMP